MKAILAGAHSFWVYHIPSSKMRNFVTFKSKEFSREDKMAHPAEGIFYGQLLAAHLTTQLKKKGFEVEEADMDDFAWTFYCKICGRTFWTHVGEFSNADNSDEWLVVVNSTLGFIKRVLGQTDDSEMRKMCWEIHQILIQDERISQVMWHTEEQFNQSDSSGTLTPI